MKLTFNAPPAEPAAPTGVAGLAWYTTPGDPPCPLSDPDDDLSLPAWMESYFRYSIETEYPSFALDDPALLAPPTPEELRAGTDWCTSGAQARELSRLGLPLARSWRMAAYLLDTYGDAPAPRKRRKT